MKFILIFSLAFASTLKADHQLLDDVRCELDACSYSCSPECNQFSSTLQYMARAYDADCRKPVVAKLTVDGQQARTVRVGTVVNYAWDSKRGASARSWWNAYGTCKWNGQTNVRWIATSLQGTNSGAVDASQIGCTFSIFYEVRNTNGQSDVSRIDLTITK